MNNIVAVNYSIPSDDESDYIDYNSNNLLSDADIVLFKPLNSEKNTKNTLHWAQEIKHILSLGKTVFVILTHTYTHTYDFLPSLPIQIVSASGIKVYSVSKIMESFYNAFSDFLDVEAYIKPIKEIDIIFTSKNKDRILGAAFKEGAGNLFLIPDIFYDEEAFWEDGWNEEGLKFGKKLKQHLSAIHNSLKSNEDVSEKPEWADTNEFEIVEATNILSKINLNIGTMQALAVENDDLFVLLKQKEILKGLLFETGKKLEYAVIHALKFLGYHAENYDDGVLELDQVITSPEGDRFIGECEGKDAKAIDISKFRQLQDGLKEDFQRDEVSDMAYGLLFGNPQRLIPPSKREFDFTDKCKKGAQREEIGLVKTVDLFVVARYLSENSDIEYQLECRKAIMAQLGQIVDFPPLPSRSE